MTFIPILLAKRRTVFAPRSSIIVSLAAVVLFPVDLAAQGQPVQNGPMLPLALWWGGACVWAGDHLRHLS